MHYNFIIYPEGLKRIQESGLDKIVETELRKHKKSLVPSHNYSEETEEILWFFENLKEEGFFKTLPFDFVKNFGKDSYQDWHQSVIKLVNKHISGEEPSWEIQRYSGKQNEAVSLEDDLPLLTGYNVSAVLSPQEFWQFKKFGFDSLPNFFGTLGAFIRMQDKCYLDRRYTWRSGEGKKVFQFEIGASEHGDFRLKKADVTPYKTFDPTAKEVFYRPETNSDVRLVSASHSVEPTLLAILLQWAEQEKIDSKILKNYSDFIASLKSQGQVCGNFADFGYSFGSSRMHFLGFDIPLQDVDYPLINKFYPHSIPCYANEGGYAILLGKQKQLSFSFIDSKGNRKTPPIIEVPKKDFDNFIEGLFHQAQRGLGRTSVKNLYDAMKYYFSPQFKSDRDSNNISLPSQ